MSIEIGRLEESDFGAVRDLVAQPALATEFEALRGPDGLAEALGDPYGSPEWRWVARVHGEVAGFAYAHVLPHRDGTFAVVRLGVGERHRRRGVGRALLETATTQVTAAAPACGEICISGYVPNEAVVGFAASTGHAHARYFWMMERPRGAVPPITWPDGIEVRTFDGSDRAFQDWTDIYNDSFADHWHGVTATIELAHHIAGRNGFDPEGLLLAYRDGRCVGHCRNEIYPSRGEVGVLGVSSAARGIGLGRALLRWGVAWLEARSLPVTLFVDGENENALRLYRSEGFEKARTRQIWSRRVGGS